MFLFLTVYERKLFQCVILLARQVYGLSKALPSFSSEIIFLKWRKVLMAINLSADYVNVELCKEGIDVNKTNNLKQCMVFHY